MTQDVEKSLIENATTEPEQNGEIEITEEMIEAGEHVILCEVGGAELGGYFSAGDLAKRVYLAMRGAETPKQNEP
jgi:hypothetical protein